jgi:hypothetical protein
LGTVTIGGNSALTSAYNPFHCAGRANSAGTQVCSTGKYNFTITKSGIGTYLINYNTAYPNSNYVINVTVYGTYTLVALGANTTTTKAELITYTTSSYVNNKYDAEFFFTVF